MIGPEQTRQVHWKYILSLCNSSGHSVSLLTSCRVHVVYVYSKVVEYVINHGGLETLKLTLMPSLCSVVTALMFLDRVNPWTSYLTIIDLQ